MPLIHTSSVTSVVIAGAGGFGLEVYDYLQEEAMGGGPRVAGFIDDTQGGRVPEGIVASHLGPIEAYRPVEGQVVVVAIGAVKGRQTVLARLVANGVSTPAYVHESAIVSPAARLGHGVLVCPFTIINRNASLEEGSVANVHCSVGHGATVGAYSVLSPYAALNGDAAVGRGCFLGTRATIYPRVSIGDECIVDSHTGVRLSAQDRQLISSRGVYQVSQLRVR